MVRVMEKLELPIPAFILRRRLVVELESKESARHQLTVYGVDVDDTPVTFLRCVKLEQYRRVARSEPFRIGFRDDLDSGPQLRLELGFMGHYGESNVEIVFVYDVRDKRASYFLEYNPHTGEWKVCKERTVLMLMWGRTAQMIWRWNRLLQQTCCKTSA